MPCTDSKDRVWTEISDPATYSLSVVGPATAYAKYDDDSTTVIETWPAGDIMPGPKIKALAAKGVHYVYVFVERLNNSAPIQIKAEVKVGGAIHQSTFCRTLQDDQEIIRHRLEMR